jgi:hypothetical protein
VAAAAPGEVWAYPAIKPLEVQGIRLQIPHDWEAVDDKTAVLCIREPLKDAADRFHENMRLKVQEVRGSTELYRIVEAEKENARAEFDVLGGGRFGHGVETGEWVAIAAKKPDEEGIRAVMINYHYLVGKKHYVLYGMTEFDHYERYQSKFLKVAMSIKFPAPPAVTTAATEIERREARESGRNVGQWLIAGAAAGAIGLGLVAVMRRVAR